MYMHNLNARFELLWLALSNSYSASRRVVPVPVCTTMYFHCADSRLQPSLRAVPFVVVSASLEYKVVLRVHCTFVPRYFSTRRYLDHEQPKTEFHQFVGGKLV